MGVNARSTSRSVWMWASQTWLLSRASRLSIVRTCSESGSNARGSVVRSLLTLGSELRSSLNDLCFPFFRSSIPRMAAPGIFVGKVTWWCENQAQELFLDYPLSGLATFATSTWRAPVGLIRKHCSQLRVDAGRIKTIKIELHGIHYFWKEFRGRLGQDGTHWNQSHRPMLGTRINLTHGYDHLQRTIMTSLFYCCIRLCQ